MNGNLAGVNTRLIFALPLPQGTNYKYSITESDYYDLVNKEGIVSLQHADKNNYQIFKSGTESFYYSAWKCDNLHGCSCGSGYVFNGKICYGDTYQAFSHGLKSECPKDCSAFCTDNQCVCGDDIFTDELSNKYRCEFDSKICMDKSGCEENGIYYKQYERWSDYTMVCNDNTGCPCGTATCQKEAQCILSENKCIEPANRDKEVIDERVFAI